LLLLAILKASILTGDGVGAGDSLGLREFLGIGLDEQPAIIPRFRGAAVMM